MAGKSKLVESALRIASEGLESLARERGQTPKELLSGFANQNPRVPYEEWRYEFEPTSELIPSKEFNPENFRPGDVIIPLVGDRTSTGRKITSIAGEKLETPTLTEGGPDYMRGPSQQEDKSVWASGKGVISQLEGRIDRARKASIEKGYKDPKVYGAYVTMGPQSGDFSTHTAEAVMGMLPNAKIKRADVKEFDRTMREKFADWPGLMSPQAADYVVNANAGEHRKAFIDAIDSAYWRDRGAPDVSLARYATTTPELISAPTEAAGYNIARITPSEKPDEIIKVHRSYPATMHGEYVGGLPSGLTRDEVFTQFSRNFDADPPARNYVMAKRRSFGMDPNAFQVMEGQDIEDLIRKVTALKSEYADGGEVYEDDDIDDALRIAKGGGGTFTKIVKNLFGPSEREGLEILTRPGSGYEGIAGKPNIVDIPEIGKVEAKPLPSIELSAEDYLRRIGNPKTHKIEKFDPLDEEFAAKVADEYERMKHDPNNPEVRRSYDALAQETLDQLKAAKEAGIDFSFVKDEDPYKLSPSMGYADLAERGHLWVYPTDKGFGSDIAFDPVKNPLLKRIGPLGDIDDATVNDAFRIVHDLYGHYGPGNPFFRAPGEERAFKLHSKMYSPEARPAMASETRGQNSWLNFGPYGRYNRKANAEKTIFADQKTGIMPPWTYEKADGGEVDDALRIAKDVGGSTDSVMMEDAKGNKYDAQGNVIPQTSTGDNPARSDAAPKQNVMFNAAPQNYSQDVQPFIDYAVTPIDRPGMPSEPDLVDVMRVATQVAAEGQPSDSRGEQNLGRRREEFVNRLYGATEDPNSPSSNQAWIANRAIDFTPWALGEIAHDIPYEAGRTGDYKTAAIEGGINAALTAPVLGLAGRGIKKGYDLAKQFPKTVAGIAGVTAATSEPSQAEAGPARWFSKALEVAREIPMQKMTGEQALAMLRKGTSPEELRWTGADAFLSGQKSVSKDDLVSFLEKNRVQPREIVLGGRGKPVQREDVRPDADIIAKYRDARDKLQQEYNDIKSRLQDETDFEKYNALDRAEKQKYRELNGITEKMIDEQIARMGGLGVPTKYHDYSTPGGEGYRETLYQYGAGGRPQVKEIDGMFSVVGPNGEVMRNSTGGPYTYWSEADANRAAKSLYRGSGSYTSGHWDDPNVLYHTRSQTLDVTPPGANRPYKAHNVDEAQSDLGQAGRKSGFRDQDYEPRIKQLNADLFAAEGEYRVKLEGIRDAYMREQNKIDAMSMDEEKALADSVRRGEIRPRQYEDGLASLVEKYRPMREPFYRKYNDGIKRLEDTLGARIGALKQERANLNIEQSKMPAMPFVGSTEGWTDRAIKSELDKALDNGADYFTWTPGEAHADRYSLEHHVGQLQYDPHTGSFSAVNPRGEMVFYKSADPDEFEGYVGEEIGEKLRKKTEEAENMFSQMFKVQKSDDGNFAIMAGGAPYIGYTSKAPVVFPDRMSANDFLNDLRKQYFEANPVKIEGLDLKVGGEGMRGYYDKVYPKRVQEVLRKATGEKPVIETIEVQTANGPRKQLGIRLTDEMREKARFSDFNKGGRVTGGNTYDNDPSVASALALTREY